MAVDKAFCAFPQCKFASGVEAVQIDIGACRSYYVLTGNPVQKSITSLLCAFGAPKVPALPRQSFFMHVIFAIDGVNMLKHIFVFTLLLTAAFCYAQITVFADDFSTHQNTSWTTGGQIGSSAFSVSRSGVDWGARRNTDPAQLELSNDASGAANAAGWVFASTPTGGFASPYNPTLKSTNGQISWYVNLRQVRTDPSGFGSGNYGVAFILAGNSPTANNNGTG